jgi:hypothetical protein
LDDEAPCTGDGQCCSLVCKGGFCAQQEVGEPCQESWSCSYGLSCENGTCQDCAGPGGWCSDTCCAGLECSEQSTCCQLTGGYCYKANECCSNKCTLWACE